MDKLSKLGFSPFFYNQLNAHPGEPARIASVHRGGYEVWTANETGPARLAGRLMRAENTAQRPAVGDWVMLRSPLNPLENAVIDTVLERRTVFTRGTAGRGAGEQVVAANVDTIFIVVGLDIDFSLHRIDRYLARVWAGGASPVVVLSKADICEDAEAKRRAVVKSTFGVPVLLTSAFETAGIDVVRDFFEEGRTFAFVGSSGVGKSTLINAVIGEDRMATSAVRERDGRGCHTTTHRQLILLPGNGLVIDTPGMREVQLFDEDGLAQVFADIEHLAAGCRFADCAHRNEPGCAVQNAVAAGRLTQDRLEHYRKLEAEASAYEVRHDEKQRREADRALGKMYAQTAVAARRFKQGK